MATRKTNSGLVTFAKKQVGQVYWYGTVGYLCTKSLLASKAKQYPDHYKQSRMAQYNSDISAGKTCFDCVGLIKSYYWTNDAGKLIYGLDGRPDKGATGMFNAAKIKGPISAMPEIPGLLLYSPGHVGIYIGDGWAIEARGFDYGVIRSRVKDRKWVHWYQCPYLEYVEDPKQEADTHDENPTNPQATQPQDPTHQPDQGTSPEYGTRLLQYKPGRKMQSGTDVTAVQARLTQLGHSPGTVDGQYGPMTADAVKSFQEAACIEVDGIVGPETRNALQ